MDPYNKYYHVYHAILQNGQFIEPGSMGKIIRNQYILNGTPNDQELTWRLFQEQTFELIRINEFSNKPSRWKSIFLFDDLSSTIEFMKRDSREGTYIYEVEIINKSAAIHRASMKLYERIPRGRPVLLSLEDQARQYWRGVNTIDPPEQFYPEILVESVIKILQKVIG